MRVHRKPVSKKSSARHFRHGAMHTKVANVAAAPQRGGWRL